MRAPARPAARRRVTAVLAAVVVALGAAAVAGCGSGSSAGSSAAVTSRSTTTTSTATSTASISHPAAKFVLHAGLASGAFHHYVWLPARAGTFRHPLLHKLSILKAAVAAVFVYHELALALTDARADRALARLVAPIAALRGVVAAVITGFRGDGVDPAAIRRANGMAVSVGRLASHAGAPIADIVTPSL
jgi:hypothetical protein